LAGSRVKEKNMAIGTRCTLKMLLVSLMLAGAAGCATVPPQAILLSRGMGSDLASVQASYRQLIRTHFQDQRDRVNAFIDTRWEPTYLRGFIQSGELVQTATGSDPAEVLAGVEDWVTVALDEIAARRGSLLRPINQQEDSLLTATDVAFAQLLRANATVTAHLESLRHVQTEQDQVLDQAGLKSLRDRIDSGLTRVSEGTQSAIDELEKDRKKLEAAAPHPKPTRH
jgi:hypothetical protein